MPAFGRQTPPARTRAKRATAARGPEVRGVRGDAGTPDHLGGGIGSVTKLLLILVAGMAIAAVVDYQSEIAAWRQKRVTTLKADGGWLAVSGLFWLHEGANSYGSDSANEVVLPDGPA